MRLIDADALGLTDMEIIMCNGNYREALKMLLDKIDHAPTIGERKTNKNCDGCAFTDCYESEYPCAICERKSKDYYIPVPKMKGGQSETDSNTD